MTTSYKYSLCFLPDEALIQKVKQMKLALADQIGWYNSKNSIAHITIAEFQSDELGINKVMERIRQQCLYFVPIEGSLDTFGHYPNGAFFLAVDEKNKSILKTYAKKIIKKIDLSYIYKSSDPHLSIARKLDPDRLQEAFAFFDKPNLPFTCSQIALRRFNPVRGQYDIIEYIPFKSLEDKEDEQLTLF